MELVAYYFVVEGNASYTYGADLCIKYFAVAPLETTWRKQMVR